jgi:hypothetical protein
MSENQSKDVTPDELMQTFRGRSLKSMLIFTLIVHAVFILATSLPGIVKNLAGGKTEDLTPEERAELATKEATAALREIAQRHGMTAQDLGTRFGSPAARSAAETTTMTANGTPESPATPPSTIEQQLNTTAEGPVTPPIPPADDEDLFK